MSEAPEGFNPDDYTMDPQTGSLQEKQDPVSRKWRRDLEKRAKQGDQALIEAAALRRELAILKAGVPTDLPISELFLKAYDGPEEAEAIKQAAIKYGLLQPSQGEQHEINQTMAGHQAAMNTAAGSQAQSGGVDHQAALRQIAAKHRGPMSEDAAIAELKQYAQEHGFDATSILPPGSFR